MSAQLEDIVLNLRLSPSGKAGLKAFLERSGLATCRR